MIVKHNCPKCSHHKAKLKNFGTIYRCTECGHEVKLDGSKVVKDANKNIQSQIDVLEVTARLTKVRDKISSYTLIQLRVIGKNTHGFLINLFRPLGIPIPPEINTKIGITETSTNVDAVKESVIFLLDKTLELLKNVRVKQNGK